MFYIYYLKPHLHNHFVLSFNEKFFILTSKPILGLKSTFISSVNINGQNKPQYIIENFHIFNSKYHLFEYSLKGMLYLQEHKEKFKPVLEMITKIT